MDPAAAESIARAKERLKSMKHASMATVNEDGTPHNTPFMFLYDKDLTHIYWGSHPDSLHSKNILRTKQAFIVIYDSLNGGGLYMRAEDAHPLEGKELEVALKVHNDTRATRNEDALTWEYYTGGSPQRMWSAKPIQFWVNAAERDSDGHVTRDYRIGITREDLIE